MTLELLLCILGVYACFLTWGITQEKVSTTRYGGNLFTHFIFLNLIQASIASVVGLLYVIITRKQLHVSKALTRQYIQLAFLNSIASPFGYASLKFIDYPTMILGKSCKLVPVIIELTNGVFRMLMNFILYKKTFPPYKYVVVALITTGVSAFMLLHPQENRKGSGSNSLFGLFLLTINLVIDGTTNSTQDHIFKKYKVSGASMMLFMNFFSAILIFFYLIVHPFSNEFWDALTFCITHHQVVYDLLIFALAGSFGQLFIFYTLERFGSLSLVTVTVTRKMFSILLSVFWFGHSLGLSQWICVLIVFGGIALEGYYSRMEKLSRKEVVAKKSVKFDLSNSTSSSPTPTPTKSPTKSRSKSRSKSPTKSPKRVVIPVDQGLESPRRRSSRLNNLE